MFPQNNVSIWWYKILKLLGKCTCKFFSTTKIKNVRSPTSLDLLSDPGEIKVPSANRYHWCVFPIAIKMTLILRKPFSTWKWKCQLLSHVQFFETPWTVAHQVPLSMEFSRQEYWVAIPFSRGSSRPRDWTWVSRTAGGFFTIWATREAFQCETHHKFSLYCCKSTKHVLTNLLQVTIILRTQRGCQRGPLQTKKNIDVPVVSKAITWQSRKDISLGPPCWWGNEPETRKQETKKDKRQNPKQKIKRKKARNKENNQREGQRWLVQRGTEKETTKRETEHKQQGYKEKEEPVADSFWYLAKLIQLCTV